MRHNFDTILNVNSVGLFRAIQIIKTITSFLLLTGLILVYSSNLAAAKSSKKKTQNKNSAAEKNPSKFSSADLKLQDAQKKLGIWSEKKNQDEKNVSDSANEEKENQGKKDSEQEVKEAKEILQKNKDSTAENPKEERVSFIWTLLKTLVVLGLISVGLFYGIRLLAKRQGLQPKGENIVDVIAQVPIQQNKQIHLVKIADEILVLGVTDSNINLLSKIDDQYTIDKIHLLSSQAPLKQKQTFLNIFLKNIKNLSTNFTTDFQKQQKKIKTSQENSYTEDNFDDLLKKQREKLNNLKNL
jgi:flagellar biogenesis protein FliO